MSPSSRLPAPSGTSITGEHSLKDARAPIQSRGQKRVDEILDAAEELIAEVGVEAMTTNAVAERAGASVGSLYHFFPSKEAIVLALAHRFTVLSVEMNHGAMSAATLHDPLDKLFERIVMTQAELLEKRPAFNAVYDACSEEVCDPKGNRQMREMIVGHVDGFLAARLPAMPKKEREVAAQLSVSLLNGVFREARSMAPELRARMLRELQLVMVRYFGPVDAKYGGPARVTKHGR